MGVRSTNLLMKWNENSQEVLVLRCQLDPGDLIVPECPFHPESITYQHTAHLRRKSIPWLAEVKYETEQDTLAPGNPIPMSPCGPGVPVGPRSPCNKWIVYRSCYWNVILSVTYYGITLLLYLFLNHQHLCFSISDGNDRKMWPVNASQGLRKTYLWSDRALRTNVSRWSYHTLQNKFKRFPSPSVKISQIYL